jgi:Reverse transcriptase (RNA-dependent DNA polymerase)
MVNDRLVWFLEPNKLITEIQSGFRKGRSTVDQLVEFETFICEAFVQKQHVVSVFFDLEKAYDTTWKGGILRDLHESGLQGRLLVFIAGFLQNSHFRVQIGSLYLILLIRRWGVPQGCILSVTLFLSKINSIVKCLPAHIRISLYVDDFVICYKSSLMNSIERQLQTCLNKLQTWADTSGLRFSKSKTACVHFYNKCRHHLDPDLRLDGTPVLVVKETKFHGIVFDSKVSFIPHLKYLKDKCLKAMNLLRVIYCTDWGADCATLLKLYQYLIKSKLHYGCIVYGSARKSYLNTLDRVQNSALRICLGAFRTSPIASLHVEAGEMPLNLRREKLTLQYVLKLESNSANPTYKCILKPTL